MKAVSQFANGVFVYDAVRTPKARVRRHGGTLADVPAYDLLAQLFSALQERGLPPEVVDDILIGTSTAVGTRAATSHARRPCGPDGRTTWAPACCRDCAVRDSTRSRRRPPRSRRGSPTSS
ncbi:hypothetical protein P9209_21855 [Prescottella defluvii]|nr:hypothetical protein P9209_21855 [Prescottella defluvii]